MLKNLKLQAYAINYYHKNMYINLRCLIHVLFQLKIGTGVGKHC